MIGRLIGMIHLGPLPGSPGYEGSMETIVGRAVADATVLHEAGFDTLLVENFGDAPFFADDVPDVTVAAMARAAAALVEAVPLPLGVNVLRNDALAAVSIAAAVGASFVRVNVLTGSMTTDQGPVVGKAAEVARLRAALGAPVAVAADVMVKHAVPPPGLTLEAAARDTWERGGADALVVSGGSTGDPVAPGDLAAVRAAVPGAQILVGSGAAPGTIAALLEVADGAIVGTAVKRDGVTTAPVDPARAAALVRAAG
ncbi:MAG: BtpA/SgcQ family protein [Actinobacteria bacterium]|nr:BtpA/SgcQ family protein [Actinomycetota bacterium]